MADVKPAPPQQMAGVKLRPLLNAGQAESLPAVPTPSAWKGRAGRPGPPGIPAGKTLSISLDGPACPAIDLAAAGSPSHKPISLGIHRVAARLAAWIQISGD